MSGTGSDKHRAIGNPADQKAANRVAYLDRALWKKIGAAQSIEEVAEFWLNLQCCMITDVVRAAVYLGSGSAGTLSAAAFWPDQTGGDGPNSLLSTARRAMAERKGVVSGHHTEGPYGGKLCCISYPFVIDGRAAGAVVLEMLDREEEALRAAMRQLQWGAAWIELAQRRAQARDSDQTLLKSGAALDLLGLLIEQPGYKTASKALVTELATRFDCELVALGFLSGSGVKVIALSHSAEFGQQMNLIRALSKSMEEAIDQSSAVVFPLPDGADYRVTLAHKDLSRILDDVHLLTLPMLIDGEASAALLFQRARGQAFDQQALDVLDAVAAVSGPVLEEKRRNDRPLLWKIKDAFAAQLHRLFGPHYLGRKLGFAALLFLVTFFSLFESTYRVSAPAKIEGRIQRVLVAPFDGYLATQSARAGDRVSEGSVLATLDNRDLKLEHMRWTTTRDQRLSEYEQALAKHDRAGVNVVKAQIDQAKAHIALLEEQLGRTQLMAPFNGIVVSGDLSQAIGAAVDRGDELFAIAPLDAYRVMLEIDETQVLDVQPGQKGQLKVASLLDDTLEYEIKQITPITDARDGRNFFRVEAALTENHERLRPGMEGVGKTEAGSRLLIQIWSEGLITWLRLKLWAWWP